MSREQIATHICGALRGLQRLEDNIKPNYDEWDAVFYSLWYQPAQINLAYTLSRTLLAEINPIARSGGAFQVSDFGCGALAMKFGLALAAADSLNAGRNLRTIAVTSCDESQSMKDIGGKIWCEFVAELEKDASVANTSELLGAWLACEDVVCDGTAKSTETPLWLTILHVAYGENYGKIAEDLNHCVNNRRPALILATSHPKFASHRFRPQSDSYREAIGRWTFCPGDHCLGRRWSPCVGAPCSERLELEGKLCVTTAFRSSLQRFISDSVDYSERHLVDGFLTKHPTWWTGIQPLEAVVYVRQP